MGFISDLKKESQDYGIPIWKLPDFILVAMGLANITLMIVTYIWASGFADDPREAVLLVAVEAAIIMVIGNVFVESAKHIIEMHKLKKEFVQIISHQIRSPLTTMKWQLEILQQSGEKTFSKKQNGYIDKIYEENERITTMVNDILNMARVEKETENQIISEVVVEETLLECIKMLDSFAKFKQIKVVFQDNAERHTVSVDSEKLKIAFVNLIENAISYSPKGSEVTISIKKTGKEIEITFKDQGIGIKKDEQDLIFQKFYRGSGGRKSQPEGTGLGLFMTKKVVEQMKGSLKFKSKVNKGTEFYLSLPLTRVL